MNEHAMKMYPYVGNTKIRDFFVLSRSLFHLSEYRIPTGATPSESGTKKFRHDSGLLVCLLF